MAGSSAKNGDSRLAMPRAGAKLKPPRPRKDVARPRRPPEWQTGDPPFVVPEWQELGLGVVAGPALSRHILLTGETGSGKTASGILPLTLAALRYPGLEYDREADRLHRAAILVLDPKRELGDPIARFVDTAPVPRQVVRFGSPEDARTLDMFEGLDALVLTAPQIVDRIFRLSESYVEAKALSRDAFWMQQAEGVLTQLIAIDLLLFRRGGRQHLRAFWKDLAAALEVGFGPDALAIDWRNYPWLHAQWINLAGQKRSVALATYMATAGKFDVPASATLQLNTIGHLADTTFSCVIAQLNNLWDIAAPEVAARVSLNPFMRPPAARLLSVRSALEDGHCVHFVPENDSAANYVARCLKSKFFELTYCRRSRRPFVFISDEFQRVVTGDAVSGEAVFLEQCRAYKAACVLATQSIGALRYALTTGVDAKNLASLEVLLNNLGTQLYFRTTEPNTVARLQRVIPEPSLAGKPHITNVRPPSSLSVGECYFLASSGRWGRKGVRLAPPPPGLASDRTGENRQP
jgi:hypothetical protein